MKSSDIEKAAAPVITSLAAFADKIKVAELDDELLAPVYDLLDKITDAAGSTRDQVKERYKALVVEGGKTFTTAGSKMLALAGWRLEVRPTGGGTDWEKLRKICKKAGVERSDYCDKEVVWHENLDKINQLIGAGKLQPNILEKCSKERGFSMVAPVRIEEKDK